MKIEIKNKEMFLALLHKLIYDYSNTCIGLEIHQKCKDFIKEIESCSNKEED